MSAYAPAASEFMVNGLYRSILPTSLHVGTAFPKTFPPLLSSLTWCWPVSGWSRFMRLSLNIPLWSKLPSLSHTIRRRAALVAGTRF